MEKTDFAFTLNGGSATLVSPTPTSISISGNVYTLGINLSGTPDGAEVVAVTPVTNSIYDTVGNISLTEQTGNTANLNDKAKPIFSNIDQRFPEKYTYHHPNITSCVHQTYLSKFSGRRTSHN